MAAIPARFVVPAASENTSSDGVPSMLHTSEKLEGVTFATVTLVMGAAPVCAAANAIAASNSAFQSFFM
jgi:hypothetical protein